MPNHPSPGEPEYLNRRAAARTDFRRAISILLLKSNEILDIRVNTHDLSGEGLAFHCLRDLSKGEHLILALPEEDKVRLVLAKVRHARRLSSGFCFAGVRFIDSIRISSEQEFIPVRWLGYKIGLTGFARIVSPVR